MEDRSNMHSEMESKKEEGKYNLSQEEHKRLKYAFDSLDPDQTGRIDVEDLRFLLRCIRSLSIFLVYGHIATEEDIKDMLVDLNLEEDTTSIGSDSCMKIGWEKLLEYFKEQKKVRSANDEADTCKVDFNGVVMAFHAMGGGPDKDGKVERSKLERVITQDFELTIDIKVRRQRLNKVIENA